MIYFSCQKKTLFSIEGIFGDVKTRKFPYKLMKYCTKYMDFLIICCQPPTQRPRN